MSNLLTNDSLHIREVWNDNLDEEFKLIRNIVDAYPYVAMDTEFPGIVSEPEGHFENREDRNYQLLKTNVNQLKLIQVGLAFSDEKGNLPTCGTDKYCIWQFNFREFKKSEDKHAPNSIELLERSGIDFNKCSEKGVKASRFGELFTSSGVVMNDEVHCITFHGGMDLGYLLKILTGKCLPDTRAGFSELLQIYFPNLYDMKHLMRFGNGLYGGLKRLAETLGVQRIGTSHQAGSDSLLTSCTFMKLKGMLAIPIEKLAGVVFGLGEEG